MALGMALERLRREGSLEVSVLFDYVGAVSVGIVEGEVLLDLDYREDSQAQVDMNIVMTGKNQFVELQGTAEKAPFSREKLERMIDLGRDGIAALHQHQEDTLSSVFEDLDDFLLSLNAALSSGHDK